MRNGGFAWILLELLSITKDKVFHKTHALPKALQRWKRFKNTQEKQRNYVTET